MPYVSDSRGRSATRTFIKKFFETYANPPSRETFVGKNKDGSTKRVEEPYSTSIYDRVYGMVPAPSEPLFENPPRDPTQTYIGRAASVLDGDNPDEGLWVLLADIQRAVVRLDERARIALGLRYVLDFSDDTIAEALGVSHTTVSRIIDRALDTISTFLDT